ncbi:MAG: hypothetical protein JXA09_02615 [Anaerolineae bacterium]|nr:hypothetical protein [Anaerolineae bacterium]
MEAVVQGHQHPFALTFRRSERRGIGLRRVPPLAHATAQHIADRHVCAILRRNMTHPVFHYAIS